VPAVVRGVVRAVLPAEAQQRALSDLEEVCARVRSRQGRLAVAHTCVREVMGLVFWHRVDVMRRVLERRSMRSVGLLSARRSSMSGVLQDIMSGWRSLARRPGFALMAAGVLGLGIGANAAIVTLADALFLEPPALVHEPERLVRVFRSWAPGMGGSLSYPDYQDYRAGATTLEDAAAGASFTLTVTARTGDEPAGVRLRPVTDNWFGVLGVQPAAGRFFLPEENRTPDTHAVAIVTWGFARDWFGDARSAVGREVRLNGHAFSVVGVLPRTFTGIEPANEPPDVYIPIMMRNAVSPVRHTAWRERVPDMRNRWLVVVGRLAPGATVASAQAEMEVIADRIRGLEGEDAEPNETVLVTQDYRWIPSTRSSLVQLTRTLLIAVSLLLLIAAANVAILLLARASTRDREVGIRSALGAGRLRIARQMLAEGAILGAVGCAVGVALSLAAAPIAASLLPVTLPQAPRPDAGTLVAVLAISVFAALAVALLPALRASRADVSGLIQGRNRRAGGGHVRDTLVLTQVALSIVLVAGAALFARSLAAARAVDIGFEAEGVLLFNVNLSNHGYDRVRGQAFVADALERLSALPGVQHATTTVNVPYQDEWTTTLEPDWSAEFPLQQELEVGLNVVSPGYFDAMRIPILRGRGFEATDVEGSEGVVVVNETFVREIMRDADPIGRLIPLDDAEPPVRIVGVARDADYYGLAETRRTHVYLPLEQQFTSAFNFMVKSTTDALALVRPVQAALHAIDPDIAIARTVTLESVHEQQLAGYRATAHVVGLTGLIALLLASAGLYGVMAFRVAQRTREIGVRMALGQTRASVARGVLRGALRLTAAGALIGLLGALALGRLVQGMVFGVPANDPVSLLVAPLVLVTVALIAVLVPARRAMAIDPMRAIRTD
jgi:predicted permease